MGKYSFSLVFNFLTKKRKKSNGKKTALYDFMKDQSSQLTALALFFSFIVLFIDIGSFSGRSQIAMVILSDLLFIIIGLTIFYSTKREEETPTVTLFRYVLLFSVFSFAGMSLNKTLENIDCIRYNDIIRTNIWAFLSGGFACLICGIIEYRNSLKKYSSWVILVSTVIILILATILVLSVPNMYPVNSKCENGFIEYDKDKLWETHQAENMTKKLCEYGCYHFYDRADGKNESDGICCCKINEEKDILKAVIGYFFHG